MTRRGNIDHPADDHDQTRVATSDKQARNAKAVKERAQIENATEQLLEGLRTGALTWPSVSELARVARVKRWVLTHKHTDLRERFQAAVAELKSSGVTLPAAQATASAKQALQGEVTRLRRENDELRNQVTFYANALRGIAQKYDELIRQRGSTPNIVALPASPPRRNRESRDTDDSFA